jgi:hypothetical protein
MLRRSLLLSVGALALLVALGAPGQLQAQHMRGVFLAGSTRASGADSDLASGVGSLPASAEGCSTGASTARSLTPASARDSAQASFVRFEGVSRETTE